MKEIADWLLLIHLLPTKPDYLRVKVWRRLQGLGAVSVKNSVYALPSSDRSREDFQWLQKEIEEMGGEASLCEARFIDGLSDDQIRQLFNAARDGDYAQLVEELRGSVSVAMTGNENVEEQRQRLRRARKRFEQILTLDFFGAPGRQACEELFKQLEAAARPTAAGSRKQVATEYVGRTWVTRPDVGVDRMASAWLILRHIDPTAKFAFASERSKPVAGQLRFDMAAADFTHEGDRCTFEVLLERFGLDDPALAAIGRIVHDLDFKDGKFREEDGPGVARLLSGMATLAPGDDARIRGASTIFDALIAAYSIPSSM
ncbi:chromate resistance protein ChrB domain-containing protein [Hydrocarboniphaga effusa]|uniref:chromate resistance protein ChrB domain-containing protein n=1 Tax=Hydrocarboniphaga effusa TaxID=243629 RepID=UPI0035B47179